MKEEYFEPTVEIIRLEADVFTGDASGDPNLIGGEIGNGTWPN